MSFLPEDDQEYLSSKGINYELLSEKVDNSERRAILFPGFPLSGNLCNAKDPERAPCTACDLLILIPSGYPTTKLDSFYTEPRLKRVDGADPAAASGENVFFGRTWQFWSRHLDPADWQPDRDGVNSYLSYVRQALNAA